MHIPFFRMATAICGLHLLSLNQVFQIIKGNSEIGLKAELQVIPYSAFKKFQL